MVRAEEHVQRGREAEAREVLELLLEDDDLGEAERARVAILASRLEEETGHLKQALENVSDALERAPTSAELWSRRAELYWRTGAVDQALQDVQQALDLNSQDLRGQLIAAHLLADNGDVAIAADQYRWFVRYYNRKQPQDWQSLMLIAEGAAQYARWQSVSDIFKFIVNTICVDALKDNSDCWQAHQLAGTLLLEKYNREQAVQEFQAALETNPRCAAALAGLARAAMYDFNTESAADFARKSLEINPAQLDAELVLADTAIFEGDFLAAGQSIDRAMRVNAVMQEVQARRFVNLFLQADIRDVVQLQAAIRSAIDSPELVAADSAEWERTIAGTFKHSTKPGPFFSIAGELLESRRLLDAAEVCYRTAIDLMPQLSAPRTSLGMLCMQSGRVEEAREILDAAFQADPFHVRVSNMRKVLDVLDGYETISTEHFVIRVATAEKQLGLEMAAYLEQIYPELTEQFGYEPLARTHFEVYSEAKGQPGHAWFSARMIGLPWIQTIGASTGRIVAVTSPLQTQNPYNWARVLRHEFTHVLTLQKTGYQIPHWYTEALAVTAERIPLLDRWQEILLDRQRKDNLFTLQTINSGFQRPQNQDDWHLAYCQARLYAIYIQQRFGDEGLARLLDAFASTSQVDAALQTAFAVERDEFERGYREVVAQAVREIGVGRDDPPLALTAAEAQANAAPEDAQMQASYAYALLQARQFQSAFETADRALMLDENNILARGVAAAGAIFRRDDDRANELLAPGLALESPHPLILNLRVLTANRAQDYVTSEELLKLLIARFPQNLGHHRDLAEVSEKLGQSDAQVRESLRLVAAQDSDDAAVRKRLARLAQQEGDAREIVNWAEEAIQIDMSDVEMHRLLAEHGFQADRPERSLLSYQALIAFEQATEDDRLGLAKHYHRLGRKTDAMAVLRELLADAPENQAAKTMYKQLDLMP